jgi:hypothetical protein
MIHFLIYAFFGSALAVGFYCLWVSLRVEFHRVPDSMRFGNGHALHPALDASPIRSASTRH